MSRNLSIMEAESNVSSIIGQRIRSLREFCGWSQEELARRIHVSVSLIGRYERGERVPPPDKLTVLADVFGVTTDYLIGRDSRSVILATRGMPLPPPGAEYLTKEELEEIQREAQAFHEYIVRKRLKEKGIEI